MAYNYQVRVEWDDAKNKANQRKHGISFEQARELFISGTDYLEIYDADYSVTEDRFIAIGPITLGVLVMVWTEREDDAIRLISARWASKLEQTLYHQHMDDRT
jgi:uncharacterized DUF497 family protein